MTTDSNEIEKEIKKLKKEIMIINQSRQRKINELYDEERDDEDWDTLIEILYENTIVIRYLKSELRSLENE